MYANKSMYRATRPIYIKGGGLIPYKQVMRGEGVGSIFQSLSTAMGRVFSNPRLRATAKRVATSTASKIFNKTLEDRVSKFASDKVNQKIDTILGGKDEGKSSELSPQEQQRAKARIIDTIQKEGSEKNVQSNLQKTLREAREAQNRQIRLNQLGFGYSMPKRRGRPRKSR